MSIHFDFHLARWLCMGALLWTLAALSTGCSTGCGETSAENGGSGGAAGAGGTAGTGGTVAKCTLTGQWETIDSHGTDTRGYGNVVFLQSPVDGSLWQVAARTNNNDYNDIALFRSDDEGTSWTEVDAWDLPSGRRGWNSGADIAADGTIFVVLREFSDTNTDRDVTLLRYVPVGALTEVGSFLPQGSSDTRSNGVVARGSEAWFIAYDGTAVPTDYHIVRYADGALSSFDVIRFGDEVYVRDLALAPNGKIWAAGSGREQASPWHAPIWEEGESGFSLLADLQQDPSVDESDTITALTFDGAGQYWAAYYTIPSESPVTDPPLYRWRTGHGRVDAPEASFKLDDDFGLDEGKASSAQQIAVHPSGVVFTGGYAYDANDWQWGIVRQGAAEGFTPSDQFIHGGDGAYRSSVTSILVDKRGNVWLAYMSRPATGWFPKLTTLKKMACIR